ncbi:hypothetical protein [Paenibacillus validus]|uniref:hypothetical protein n=1 Tax=Paenibacillus validus TaxID=44253 RepID=UPI003D2DE3AE
MWKQALLAASLLLPLTCAPAEAAKVGPLIKVVEPEPMRIPSTIHLLAKTPMYKDVDTAAAPADGLLAPQHDVIVLGGQYDWARGRSWWKIQTWLGERWISPEPWNVDVPPPTKLTLLDLTPLYAARDASLPPSAELTPQEVQVVDAEKQWFYSNDPNEKKWIKIRTTWLGDQWLQLPVGQIGYIKPLDTYAYYGGEPVYSRLPANRYQMNPEDSDLRLENETVHLIGEYVTVYDHFYLTETKAGRGWVANRGAEAIRRTENVDIQSDTPLIPDLTRPNVYTVLQPQTVQSFERLADEETYHVRTPQGEGWIRTAYAEPTDAKPISLTVKLGSERGLNRFPFALFPLDRTLPAGETIRTTAYYWKGDPWEPYWYQVEPADGSGKAWLQLDPRVDRIDLPGEAPAAYAAFQQTQAYTIAAGPDATLRTQGKTVGYLKDGVPYFALEEAAPLFNFELGEADGLGRVEVRHPSGYSLVLQPGQTQAETRWNGHVEETVPLREKPTIRDGQLILQGDDLGLLLGTSIDWFESRQYLYLFTDQYRIDTGSGTFHTDGNRAHATMLLLDRSVQPYEPNPALAPKLVVRQGSGEASTSNARTVDSGWLPPSWKLALHTASAPQMNASADSLSATVTLGARILWKRDLSAK